MFSIDFAKNADRMKVVITTTTVMVIFDFLLNRGLVQTRGNMNGPTQIKEATSDQVLKYHFG